MIKVCKSMRYGAYVATKLYSFFDRKISEEMFEAIQNSSLPGKDCIYLPYRDSNMKICTEGDIANLIFETDIEAMDNSAMVISRMDGLSYDAGVGFEIGYFFAQNKPIIVFSTDFMKNRVLGRRIIISSMLCEISTEFIYDYSYNTNESYKEELDRNIYLFREYVIQSLDSYIPRSYHPHIDELFQNTFFIDICGNKYEWSKMMSETIKNTIEEGGYECWISQRYNQNYDIVRELSALRTSKCIITCYDENEPDLDSCILQGIAYHDHKYIIGYETSNVVYYVEGKQEMTVNLMLEQSCNYIARSFCDLKKHIHVLEFDS